LFIAAQPSPVMAGCQGEPIYNWFTEGFDTADLKDAKSLLEELASNVAVTSQSGAKPVSDKSKKSRAR
jgi:hypothetical protein